MNNLAQTSALTRRDFLKSGSFLLGTVAVSGVLPGLLFAQDDAARVDAVRKQLSGTIQVTKVSGNVSVLYGAGGNIGILIGPEGKFIVDSGVAPSTAAVLQAINQIDALPLKYLINTHWHFDHTDGNGKFHESGAAIVATDKTRERLSTPQYVDALQLHFPSSPAAALPTRTLNGAFTFYHDGEEILLQALPPAHTDTDLFVYFHNADVLHAGDVFFNGFYPLIDYSTGGNANGYVDSMSKMIAAAKDSTKIIPGHGPVGSKGDLVAAHDMLATVRDRVAAAKRSGKSVDETVALKPSAEFDAKYGKGLLNPDLFITILYKSLA
jgi:cyclase